MKIKETRTRELALLLNNSSSASLKDAVVSVIVARNELTMAEMRLQEVVDPRSVSSMEVGSGGRGRYTIPRP